MATSLALRAADSPATDYGEQRADRVRAFVTRAGRPGVRNVFWGIFLLFASIVAMNLTGGRVARHASALLVGGIGCLVFGLLILVSWRCDRNTRNLRGRVETCETDLREFLRGAKQRDPVYGPNAWTRSKEVAEDDQQEKEWRARRDAAYWEHQRNLEHSYTERFAGRVMVLVEDIPARFAPKSMNLPHERFARPTNDSDMKDVLEYLAVTAERLRRA